MSVISYRELIDERGMSVNEKGERSYTREWEVWTSSPTDGSIVVVSALGIGIGDTYSSGTDIDIYARLKKIRSRQGIEKMTRWIVTAEYDTAFDPPDFPNDPTLEPAQIVSIESGEDQVAFEIDQAGQGVVNSAGEPFEGLTEPKPYQLISLRKNSRTFTRSAWKSAHHKVYNASLLWPDGATEEADTMILLSYSAAPKNGPTGSYYEINARVRIEFDAKYITLIDQGYRYLGNDGDLVAALDGVGNPLGRPSLLNGLGSLLGTGLDPVELDFQLRASSAWETVRVELGLATS